MIEYNLIQGDCAEELKKIKSKSVDLVIIDPPYIINNTSAGGKSQLARSIQGMNNEISQKNLTSGYNYSILDELIRIMKKPNIYIWSSKDQIPIYLKYFVDEHKYSFDILCWVKTNATPLFNNKYLTDKEYCLYFRKGGRCQPNSYEEAKTIWNQPINIKDKKKYGHPTIKPVNIIETLIKNSSNKNDVILDCFMGSGTTGVACKRQKRNFIGIEIDKQYFEIAKLRIEQTEELVENEMLKNNVDYIQMTIWDI